MARVSRLSRICLLFFSFAAAASAHAGISPRLLPALDGSLSGELQPFGPSSAQTITWSVKASTLPSGERNFALTFRGDHALLAAEVRTGVDSFASTWELTESHLSLEPWFALVAGRYAPALRDFRATGEITLTGSGELLGADHDAPAPAVTDSAAEQGAVPAEPALRGRIRASLTQATFGATDESWSASGISLSAIFPELPTFTTAPRQRLSVAEIKVGQHVFGNLSAELQLVSPTSLQVQALRVAAFGGIVRVEPFTLDLASRKITCELVVEGAELHEMKLFFPEMVDDIEGKVSGRIRLKWSPEKSIELDSGQLVLDAGKPASLLLKPSPGLLSSRVPPEIQLAGFGPRFLRRWFTIPNPSYAALQRIENGEERLAIQRLDGLYGDQSLPEGVNAATQILTTPTTKISAEAVRHIRFNFRIEGGGLETMLRLGSSGRVSLEFSTGK